MMEKIEGAVAVLVLVSGISACIGVLLLIYGGFGDEEEVVGTTTVKVLERIEETALSTTSTSTSTSTTTSSSSSTSTSTTTTTSVPIDRNWQDYLVPADCNPGNDWRETTTVKQTTTSLEATTTVEEPTTTSILVVSEFPNNLVPVFLLLLIFFGAVVSVRWK